MITATRSILLLIILAAPLQAAQGQMSDRPESMPSRLAISGLAATPVEGSTNAGESRPETDDGQVRGNQGRQASPRSASLPYGSGYEARFRRNDFRGSLGGDRGMGRKRR
ncbi:MAG: hypothetical protein IPJ52_14880 [Rhodocyclaceae bacterium]|nr:hypothetical protein [Rhodocyclaceae bacterium]